MDWDILLMCTSSYQCNVQGVARHWRNPIRTRVTPLDSSDDLYIVFLAYTVKPMDNVVRFRPQCVGPVRFAQAPITGSTPIASLPWALYALTYYWFSLCALTCASLHQLIHPLCQSCAFTHATIDIVNNYLRLRSTTTTTGKLNGAISKCIYNIIF